MTRHYGAIRVFAWILRVFGVGLIVGAFVLAVKLKSEADRVSAIITFVGLLSGGVVMMFWGELAVAIADAADHARHAVSLMEGRLPALLRQITGLPRKDLPDLGDERLNRPRR